MSDLFLVTFIILNQIGIIWIALRIKKIGFSSAQSLSRKSLKNDDERNWEVQEALGRVQLLEKKSEEKEKLIKFIGHDLKAPLQNIRSSIELYKLKNSKDPAHFDHLDQIALSGLTLINDLLNPTKKIDSKFEISHDDHCNIICELTGIIKNHSMGQSIVHPSYRGEFSPVVTGQKTYVKQIIENIISNAFKYSPKNSVVKINWREAHDYISLSISDEGQGIPEKERELVLRPNYRLNRDKDTSGHGVGLYFCVHEIEKMGGKLTLGPNKGHPTGTTVELVFKKANLPDSLMQREVSKAMKSQVTHEKPKSGSVLIVDDSPDIHLILGLYLEEYNSNLKINSATKLSEAKSLLRQNKYDICFVDLNIKEEKGERVLEESAGAKIFIAMSAEISPQEKLRLENLGFSTSILKQFNFEMIKKLLSDYL